MIENTSEFAGVVYMLHNGDFTPRYIGQTTRPVSVRFSQHKHEAMKGTRRPVYHWMRKHGDAVQVCVIETFDADTVQYIDEREIFHIGQCRDLMQDVDNLNLTDGGEGTPGVIFSKETRAKMSARKMGNTINAGRVWSPESREKARLAMLGNRNINSPKASHTRWHVNRGITKPGCNFCPTEDD